MPNYRLEQHFKKVVDARFKPARYQILLAARLLMDGKRLPRMNSREMGERAETMAACLRDDLKAAELFLKAADIVDEVADEVAGEKWNRDTIRTEPVTKAIFKRFGLQQGAA